MLIKLGLKDDPEAFIELFEHAMEACDWPTLQREVHLLPLLSRKAQLIAQQLPVMNLLVYMDLKQAILNWVGHTTKNQH